MSVLLTRKRPVGALILAVLGLVAVGTNSGAEENGSAPQPKSDSVGAAVNDTAITAQVRAKLNGTDGLNGSNIRIQTTNGVVTLTGTVKDSQAKDQAAQIAQKVDGVKSVDNQLNAGDGALARGERSVSDSWITTKVKSKLLANNASRGFKVDVSTANGVVILKGILPNEQDVRHVTDLARQVEGVKSVDASALSASSQ